MVDQLNAFAGGSHARGARGGHRRQARRPGGRAGRGRHLEGPHRQRQLDGLEPDGPGPQHRRRDHRGRERRPLEENHGRRRGEILQLKETINTMVEQLRSFASEVTRVAREVGTEGRLGGQAPCPAWPARGRTSPTPSTGWRNNLTTQVRNIAEVTTAVARGDLYRKITVDVKGEILELKNTINTMVDQLNAFAGEVTRVAREVGTEGKLGGQAQVPRRGRHLERPHRQRQLHGLEPDRAGARHRQGRDGGGRRQPDAEADGAGQRRNRRAGRHDQRHDRHAGDLRRPGHQRGARGGRRRPPRRPGQRAGRGGYLEGPDRQREPAGRQSDDAGARHRRSRHGRDEGRPDALDPGRNARRSRRAERQHQHDDLEPARDDRAQSRAGLAEDEPRAIHRHAAGPARADHGRPVAADRTGAARERAAGHDLPHGRLGRATPSSRCSRATRRACDLAATIRIGEGLVGQCARREETHPADRRPGRFRQDRIEPGRRRSASASSCCPCCSKARPRP